MAGTKKQETHMEQDALTKTEFAQVLDKLDKLEGGLFSKMDCLLKPITDKLDQMNLNLQNVAKVAEEAHAMAATHAEEIKALKAKDDQLQEQIVILSNRSRFFNLKLRGMAEEVEKTEDLMLYMSNWLKTILNIKNDSVQIISQAYRLGKQKNTSRPFPRDIIVTLTDITFKKQILDIAKEHGHLNHGNEQISVFPDLAPEALAKRRELKEIVATLREANLRFRWITPLKIQVSYKAQVHTIFNEESGMEVLQLLKLPKPPRTERQSVKRKIQLVNTPPKDPKKAPWS